MTPDDLGRILATEEPLIPSSGFAASVMEQVREAASAPPPLPFPWRRFLFGLFSVSALAGLCGWLVSQPVLAALASPRMPMVLSEAATAFGVAYALMRLTVLATGGRR
jgi:hypothetical protein